MCTVYDEILGTFFLKQSHMHRRTRTHVHTHTHVMVFDGGTSCTTGKGCVYSFDPVGSYERETYRAGGSSASMLQPLLDNQVCLLTICTFNSDLH